MFFFSYRPFCTLVNFFQRAAHFFWSAFFDFSASTLAFRVLVFLRCSRKKIILDKNGAFRNFGKSGPGVSFFETDATRKKMQKRKFRKKSKNGRRFEAKFQKRKKFLPKFSTDVNILVIFGIGDKKVFGLINFNLSQLF